MKSANKTIYLSWSYKGLIMYTAFCDTKYIHEYNNYNKDPIEVYLDTFFDMIKERVHHDSLKFTYDLKSL